jgi:hypothetical protein
MQGGKEEERHKLAIVERVAPIAAKMQPKTAVVHDLQGNAMLLKEIYCSGSGHKKSVS